MRNLRHIIAGVLCIPPLMLLALTMFYIMTGIDRIEQSDLLTSLVFVFGTLCTIAFVVLVIGLVVIR